MIEYRYVAMLRDMTGNTAMRVVAPGDSRVVTLAGLSEGGWVPGAPCVTIDEHGNETVYTIWSREVSAADDGIERATVGYLSEGHDGAGWYWWDTDIKEGCVGSFETGELAALNMLSSYSRVLLTMKPRPS